MRIFPARITLIATAPIRVHAQQSAIIYSLLSHANAIGSGASPAMPDGLLPSVPEQARMVLKKGEAYHFGLTVIASTESAANEKLGHVLLGLDQIGKTPPAAAKGLSGNFSNVRAQELVTFTPSTPADRSPMLAAIPQASLDQETERLRRLTELTLRFQSPLRCERPNDLQCSGATCFNESLFLPDVFLRRASRRLHELGFLDEPGEISPRQVELIENRLVWLDVSYGPREHRKALGGAVGRVRLHVRDRELARILVLGQYLRVGEKTRFGFGAFRVEELGPDPYACPRSSGLLALALHAPELDSIAEDCGVEQGRMAVLVEQVLSGGHEPRSPRKFLIRTERPGDAPRLLCVPHAEDRALQSAVLVQIAPALDLFFEESSLAYRKGLGRQRAAQRLRDAYRQGFHWAIRADIHRFFDSIDHAILRDRLECYLADDQLVSLIMRWVENGAVQPGRGIPTGSPLSPLLSNLLLDRFDEQIEAEGARLVRYADDFLILFKRQEDAQPLLAAAQAAARRLLLHLNEDKTQLLDLAQPFEFLGYNFTRRAAWELATKHTLRHVDDLGWEQAPKRAPNAVADYKIPGEVDAGPSAFSSLLIVGPSVSWVGLRDKQLLCRTRAHPEEQRFQLHRVDELVILGAATLDADLLARRRGDPLVIWLADDSGQLRSIILDDRPLDNAELLKCQVRAAADPARCLAIAQALVVAKLHHYALLADATSRDGRAGDAATALLGLADRAAGAAALDELIGVEGAGAAAWYRSFGARIDRRFQFDHRVAPNAADPINVLLNIGFTWLYRFAELIALRQGLAPSLGFLHQARSGHAALASDLIEPFRHVVDRAVVIASRRLRPADFRKATEGPYQLRIEPAAAKSFVVLLQESLAVNCVGFGQTEPRSYRHQLVGTVRSLHRHLLDPNATFQVFRHPR